MVLAEIAIHLELHKEVVEGIAAADELILHVRHPPGSRGEGQVLRLGRLVELHGIDIRKSIAKMQVLDGMNVHTRLTTQDAGIARCKPIGWGVADEDCLAVLVRQFLAEDVVTDAIGEERQLCRHDGRGIVHPQVELPTGLGLQAGIAQLIPLGALMYTIGGQLADVRCAESTGDVHLDVEVFQKFISQSNAAGHTIEVAFEGLETERRLFALLFFQKFAAVEGAMVVSDTAADVPLPYLLTHVGKHAIVEEVVGGNQELRSLVLRLLPHTVDARGELPSVHLGREVVQVVVHGVELEVESALIGILFLLKLLTAVLLVAQEELQVAVAQEPGVVEHHLVVVYLLIGHRLAVTLGIVAFGHEEVARPLVPLPLHDARRTVVVVEGEVGMALAVIPTEELGESLLTEGRAEYIAVVFVLVGMRHLAAIAGVPHEASLVAGEVE